MVWVPDPMWLASYARRCRHIDKDGYVKVEAETAAVLLQPKEQLELQKLEEARQDSLLEALEAAQSASTLISGLASEL